MLVITALILILVAYFLTKYLLLSKNDKLHTLGVICMFGLFLQCFVNLKDEPFCDYSLFCLCILILIPLTSEHIK